MRTGYTNRQNQADRRRARRGVPCQTCGRLIIAGYQLCTACQVAEDSRARVEVASTDELPFE